MSFIRNMAPSCVCAMMLVFSAAAQTPLSCSQQSAGTPSARAEGHYEATGNLLIVCSNGSPAAGVRYTGVEVESSTALLPITSRTLDSANAITEALLFIGDVPPAQQVVCQTPLTPENCQTANVFPGIRAGPSRLRFVFPFRDPGPSAAAVLRITNLRVAASQLGIPQIQNALQFRLSNPAAGVAPAPELVLPLGTNLPTAATAQASVRGQLQGAAPSFGCESVNGDLALNPAATTNSDGRKLTIRFQEISFPSSFLKRTNAAPAPGGTPPAPDKQDLPGVNYQTESGFYNPAFPGIYAGAGLAASGTRFFVRVHDVPSGVTMFAPGLVALQRRGVPTGSPDVQTGWARRVQTGLDGDGAFAPHPDTSPLAGGLAPMDALGAFHQAVYEIVETDSTNFEWADVAVYPAFLVSSNVGGTLTFSTGLAPLSADVTGESGITPRFAAFPVTPATAATIFGCVNLSIAPQTAPIVASGGAGTVTVTATAGTAWTAISNASWITVTAGASGQSGGSVSYTVAHNPTASVRTGTITIGTVTFTINQAAGPAQPILLTPAEQSVPAAVSGISTFTVTSSDPWTAVSDVSWLSVVSTSANQVNYSITANSTSFPRTGRIRVNGVAFTVNQARPNLVLGAGLSYVPVTPCRVADTRENLGAFGLPALAAGVARSFNISASPCGIPASAAAYALNLTVVPHGPLGYLTAWPTNTPQPFVSTLNSIDGRVKANSAIVPNITGSVSMYATDATDLVIDINGYFILTPPSGVTGLAFYPLPPCRVLDTRDANSALGGPILTAATARSIPVRSSNCGVPATALAYSLNATAVPTSGLGYLTLWPSGQTQPFVSTLNSPATVVANAAIIAAGDGGAINAFVSNESHLVLDINGYFAPAGQPGALKFNSVLPCRLADTRLADAAFGGPTLSAGQIRNWQLWQSPCGIPATAEAYSLNATVVPPSGLGYLTIWPDDQAQPLVSTLNAADDPVVSNAVIVPAGTGGAVASFVTDQTALILDLNGYFAP